MLFLLCNWLFDNDKIISSVTYIYLSVVDIMLKWHIMLVSGYSIVIL